MGISIWHLLIIVGIVLLFFGPQRLPGLGKSVGEAIRGFKKGLDGSEIDVTESSEKLSAKKEGHSETSSSKHKDKV